MADAQEDHETKATAFLAEHLPLTTATRRSTFKWAIDELDHSVHEIVVRKVFIELPIATISQIFESTRIVRSTDIKGIVKARVELYRLSRTGTILDIRRAAKLKYLEMDDFIFDTYTKQRNHCLMMSSLPNAPPLMKQSATSHMTMRKNELLTIVSMSEDIVGILRKIFTYEPNFLTENIDTKSLDTIIWTLYRSDPLTSWIAYRIPNYAQITHQAGKAICGKAILEAYGKVEKTLTDVVGKDLAGYFLSYS